MLSVIAAVTVGVLVLGVGAWAWMTREGSPAERDMGTISGQWIAEHRSQERQSDSGR
jgi:hypothetical protein